LNSSFEKNVGMYALMSLFAHPVRNDESTDGNMACPEINAMDWRSCLLFILQRYDLKVRKQSI
jgi:hypothetical protein